MVALIEQLCVAVGSHCKVHGKRIGDDGMCSVRRGYLAGVRPCLVCGNAVDQKVGRTLNPLIIELREHLAKPLVGMAVMPPWLKLVKSMPMHDALCPDCSMSLIAGVNSGTGKIWFDGEATKGIPITVPFAPDQNAIVSIAEKILGRERVTFALKMEHLLLTQCIVAANAPHVCGTWGDWAAMPTLSQPTEDGSPSRAHFAFCTTCAGVLTKNGYTMGPSLKDMIRGPRNPVTALRLIEGGESVSDKASDTSPVLCQDPECRTPDVRQAYPYTKKEGDEPIFVCGACLKRRKNADTRTEREARRNANRAKRLDGYVKGPSGGGGQNGKQKGKGRR